MTKDVLIAIKGLQYTMGENADDQRVETLNRGKYAKRNGHHIVAFEESPDGENMISSLVKFTDDSFELTRRGVYNMQMLFEAGNKCLTDYNTPFGNFIIGIDTYSINKVETENEIKLSIDYDMELNYEHVARCQIEVLIKSV